MGWLPICGSEFIRKLLRTHPIDPHRVDMIGYRCIPCLDGPERFAESIYSCTGVEDNLRSIQREHHPVLWMVATVADVYCDFPERRLEHRMAKR